MFHLFEYKGLPVILKAYAKCPIFRPQNVLPTRAEAFVAQASRYQPSASVIIPKPELFAGILGGFPIPKPPIFVRWPTGGLVTTNLPQVTLKREFWVVGMVFHGKTKAHTSCPACAGPSAASNLQRLSFQNLRCLRKNRCIAFFFGKKKVIYDVSICHLNHTYVHVLFLFWHV